MNNTNGNSILKLLGVILLAIVILWVVSTLIFGTGFGMNSGFNGGYGEHMNMNYGAGYGTTGIISTILQLLIKVLFVFLVLGLIFGALVIVKKYVFNDEDIQKIKSTFAGKTIIKESCLNCRKELNDDWKVCPFCGNEKEKIKI